MLGGLGKLAAEGLAHRTEKATEEAGKNLRLLSTWIILSGWRLDSACAKLIPAGLGQALAP